MRRIGMIGAFLVSIQVMLAAPTATTPLSPIGTVTDRRPAFQWNSVPGATWYRLWIQKAGVQFYIGWMTTTTWTPPADLEDGNYQWWVQTWGGGTNGPWSSGAAFTRTQPSIVSSVDGVSNDGGDIDLVAGTGIAITPDAANQRITIASTVSSGAIQTDHIADGAITAAKLAPNAIVLSSTTITGTVSDEHVSTNVALLNASQTFTGTNVFLGGVQLGGAISLGNTTAATEGTIRWTGTDFEGFRNGMWVSFTVPVSDGMVRVPAGTFLMGWIADGISTQQVTLSSFYMGKHIVTYGQWYSVRQWASTHGYNIEGIGREGDDGVDGAPPTASSGEPATMINWRDMVVWCNAKSEKEGLAPVYTYAGQPIRDSANTSACDTAVFNTARNGYRLPTEAEWEWAARCVDGWGYIPGDYPSGSIASWGNATASDAVGWYSANSGGHTHVVGVKKANHLGLFDMGGNVQECCWDWSAVNYTSPAVTNPVGPSTGTLRQIRGGAVHTPASDMRSAYRNITTPGGRYYMLGFRYARNL